MDNNIRCEKNRLNYLLLLATITIGVMLGNLLSTMIITKVAGYEAKKALAESTKFLEQTVREIEKDAQRSQQQRAAQQAEAQKALARQQADAQKVRVRQRAADVNGLKLARNCEEWRQADLKRSSYTTQTEAAKHCQRYEKYLETGFLPN